ncbi:MAG: acyltransferase [Prevotella sp.]
MRRNELLTHEECAAMRGIAILGIILHNYCHWLSFAVKECEYTFKSGCCDGLWQVITHPDAYLPVHLLSFFGHYGVPVFLFLSGYGLVMKYERQPDALTPRQFLWHHYKKLFRIMIVGFAAFLILDAVTPGSFTFRWYNVLAQLLMVINFLPEPNRIITPGPFWFFGLMMQLYIVYRMFIYRRSNAVAVALVLACWLAQVVCEPEGESLNRLRYNFIGGMLPFCAGVLFARMPLWEALSDRMSWWHWCLGGMLLSAVAVLFCFDYQTWFWVPLLVVGASIAAVRMLPSGVLTPLVWTGGVSAALFVTHPMLRKIFIPISRHGDVYDGLMLYLVSSLVVAWMFNRIISGRSR